MFKNIGEKIKLIGTSALRNAKNSDIFCQRAKNEIGFDIEIISGEQEAEYIFLGNNLAYNWENKTALISVEEAMSALFVNTILSYGNIVLNVVCNELYQNLDFATLTMIKPKKK